MRLLWTSADGTHRAQYDCAGALEALALSAIAAGGWPARFIAPIAGPLVLVVVHDVKNYLVSLAVDRADPADERGRVAATVGGAWEPGTRNAHVYAYTPLGSFQVAAGPPWERPHVRRRGAWVRLALGPVAVSAWRGMPDAGWGEG